MNYTTKDARGSQYPTFGQSGPVKTGATTGRGGFGYDSSNNPNLLDDAGNIVLSTGTNSLVANGAFSVVGNSTFTGTTAFTGNMTHTGLISQGSANSVLTAAGSVIANAAAVTSNVHWVNGADDTKGVILPSGNGQIIALYNNHATAGLKVYPPVNGTINGGSASAAVVQEGNTTSLFVSVAAGDYRSIAFTANS